jgi:integrase
VAAARDKALALRKAVQDLGDPAREFIEQKQALTVKELIARYIEQYARPHLKSWKAYQDSLNRDVGGSILADRKARAVHRADVADLLNKLAGRSGVVANRTQAMLSSVFSWAVSEGLVDANPVKGLSKRTDEGPRERTLSDEEIRRCVPVFRRMGQPYGVAFLIVLLTGCRPGEAAGIQGSEIDLKAGVWTVPKERSKNKSAHAVPLVGEAGDFIRALAKGGGQGPLLSKPRGGVPSPQDLSQAFQRLPAGVLDGHATPHDLRRTAATILERLEINRLYVGAVLNHKSTVKAGMTGGVYSQHDFLPQKTRALEALDAEIRRIVTGEADTDKVVRIGSR